MAKKNKRFNYKPRFQDATEKNQSDDIQTKWQSLKGTRKPTSNFLTSPLFLVLFLITILIVIYVLGRYE